MWKVYTRPTSASDFFDVRVVEIENRLVFFLVPGPQYSYQKCHQICSTGKFAEQNSRFFPFLAEFCMGGTLRM
jgi:hypothetical protein